MNKLIVIFISLCSFSIVTVCAQDEISVDPKTGKKVIYTYKDNEKLDFDEITIEGDSGIPSDLSIGPIVDKKFSNRLPYRKSFNAEIRKGIERVR